MKTECGLLACIIKNNVEHNVKYNVEFSNELNIDSFQYLKKILYDALLNIQHRGQDSFGYITIQNEKVIAYRDFGLLCNFDIFLKEQYENGILDKNIMFLGHMRYSTNTLNEKHPGTLDNNLLFNSFNQNNIQPIEICKKKCIYIVHNGNLPNLKNNIKILNKKLNTILEYNETQSDTYLFKTLWNYYTQNHINGYHRYSTNCSTDCCTECSTRYNIDNIINYIRFIINCIPGAYSCVISYSSRGRNYLFGFRDKYGYKPLSICKIIPETIPEIEKNNNKHELYTFVSETIQILNSETRISNFISDVNPGEIWCISDDLLDNINIKKIDIDNSYGCDNTSRKVFFCSLEAIYFMKKDSLLFNGIVTVNNFRKDIGRELALQEKHLQITNSNITHSNITDHITSNNVYGNNIYNKEILYIPESSYSIACGYKEIMTDCPNIRNDLIFKIENIRSFIENTHDARIGKLKRKFSFNIEDIKKLKEIILMDDSIVRGNSMKFIIDTLYSINKNLIIHVRIGCPKIILGCKFGIDLYDHELLIPNINNNNDNDNDIALCKYFNIASIMFLDITRLQNIFNKYGVNNCLMCFGKVNNENTHVLEW
jgi:glutamine phosphoribosylpyrophosphate amidotransferase